MRFDPQAVTIHLEGQAPQTYRWEEIRRLNAFLGKGVRAKLGFGGMKKDVFETVLTLRLVFLLPSTSLEYFVKNSTAQNDDLGHLYQALKEVKTWDTEFHQKIQFCHKS